MASAVEQPYDDEIDLSLVIARLWVARWWIVASVIACTAAFTAYAFLSTRIYSSSTVFVSASADRSGLSESLRGSFGGLASLAGINLNSSDTETQEALAVLKSRQFTEAFIQDRQLMPVLYWKVWDAQTKSWKPGKRPPSLAKAYKYFNTQIRGIVEDKKTSLIELKISWKDREQAADWANELLQRLNEEMRKRAIAKADASLGYLETELQKTAEVGTREAINRLMEAQIKQRMLANVTQEYAFRVVDRALPPDANDPIKPRRVLLMAAGPLVGFSIGVAAVLFGNWLLQAIRALRVSQVRTRKSTMGKS